MSLECPKCKSSNNKIYSVRKYPDKIVRYRECNECNNKFKSIEKLQSGWDYEVAIEKIKKIVDKL
ncbi:MAG: hypothetical protein AYK22_04545 [Thermoplasmatales archaeon SG8-52-3]|nr:MAG: hypothetical protein AYK22_04545 [Thermoplasmatales archaeon SG8-52-3]